MELSQGKDRFKEGIALLFTDAFLTLEQEQSQTNQQRTKLLTCLVYFELHQKEACSLSINSFFFKVLPINNAHTLFLYKLSMLLCFHFCSLEDFITQRGTAVLMHLLTCTKPFLPVLSEASSQRAE